MGSSEVVSVSTQTMPLRKRPRHPGVQVLGRRHRDIGIVIDRRAHGVGLGRRVGLGQFDLGRGAHCATVGAAAIASMSSISKCAATRLVMVLNSIALRKAISSLGSGSCTANSSGFSFSGTLSSRVTSLQRNAGIVGILDQGLAALVLLDLAGALQKRFDIAIDD